MLHLVSHGFVPLTGPVSKTGTRSTGISVRATLVAVDTTLDRSAQFAKIADAAHRKAPGVRLPECVAELFTMGYTFPSGMTLTSFTILLSRIWFRYWGVLYFYILSRVRELMYFKFHSRITLPNNRLETDLRTGSRARWPRPFSAGVRHWPKRR